MGKEGEEMKYFGRMEMEEGGLYPKGLHWGRIVNRVTGARLEHYICLMFRLPVKRMAAIGFHPDLTLCPGSAFCQLHFVWFAAWPSGAYAQEYCYLRQNFHHFWMPVPAGSGEAVSR